MKQLILNIEKYEIGQNGYESIVTVIKGRHAIANHLEIHGMTVYNIENTSDLKGELLYKDAYSIGNYYFTYE